MNQAPQDSIETLITEETEKRLKEMGSPEYQYPKKLGKADAVTAFVLAGVCAVLILLCMTGVVI